MLPSSRAEALEMGVKHYFTGKPCRHGHLEKRVAPAGGCLGCFRMRQKERLQDPAYRAKHREQTLAYKHRVLADPVRRREIRERESQLHRASESRKKKKAAADAIRNRRPETRERARQLQKRIYHSKYKYDPSYKERIRTSSRAWYVVNREKCYASTAMRRFLRDRSADPWNSADMRKEVAEIYAWAKEETRSTGIRHVVDHIVPLRGKEVCGLHVPWNLRVIQNPINASKGNRLPDPVDWLAPTSFNQQLTTTESRL